jgi:hypothetical protein
MTVPATRHRGPGFGAEVDQNWMPITNPDGDAITAVLQDGPGYAEPGSFQLHSDGGFQYQPASTLPPDYDGYDSFTYKVFDSLLYSGLITVSLHIAAQPAGFSAKLIDMTFRDVPGQGKHHTMFSDDGLVEFKDTNKHWLDKNGNGTIELGQGDHSWPVAYTRNSRMAVTATFQLNAESFNLVKQALQQQKLKVRGTQEISENYVFDAANNQITLNEPGRTLTITNVAANQLLPNTIRHITNLTLEWKLSLDGGVEWIDAGKSESPVFVLLSDPKYSDPKLGKTLYYTVVYLGCDFGWGLDNAAQLPDALMSTPLGNGFASRAISTVKLDERGLPPGNDEENHQFTSSPLRYYGSWTTESKTTADLLKTKDGMCGAWARFFIDILAAQGAIGPNDKPYISLQPTARAEFFLVKNWSIPANPNPNPIPIATDLYIPQSVVGNYVMQPNDIQRGVIRNYHYVNVSRPGDSPLTRWAVSAPGKAYQWAQPPMPQVTYVNQTKPNDPNNSQNNNNPQAILDNHAVVKISNTYYDPSYGRTYASLGVIDDQLVDGFFQFRRVAGMPANTPPAMLAVTLFIRRNDPGRDFYERVSAYGT